MENQSILFDFNEEGVIKLLKEVFKDEKWLQSFLTDTHHGIAHGMQVQKACLKLVKKLTPREKEIFVDESNKICTETPNQWAITSLNIAAIFHDCGRFNDDGQILAEEQNSHAKLSARRAAEFCKQTNLDNLIPTVTEAILCHDFQNDYLTPHLKPPQKIIAKILQSADQMGWFHPDSIQRTLAYNAALGIPFYDPRASLKERLEWRLDKGNIDALSVMINQLFGPTGEQRFGIDFARNKIKSYKIKLEENIIKLADSFQLKPEALELLREFKQHKS